MIGYSGRDSEPWASIPVSLIYPSVTDWDLTMDWSKLKMVPSATVTFTTSSAARSIHAMLPRKAIRVQTSARATWGEYVYGRIMIYFKN